MNQTERRFSYLVLFCAIALLALLHWPLLTGSLYASGDTVVQNLPFRVFYQNALRAGQSFLWMPQIFCGFYVQGEGQGGMCHPCHLFLYYFLPIGPAMMLELSLSYVWMFVGSFLMLRRFAFAIPASLFGAMSFTFCGFNMMHYGHMNAIEVVSHLPWIVYAIDVILQTRDRVVLAKASAGLAVLFGSQLLLGYPFYFLCSFFAASAFTAWKIWGRESKRRLIPLFASLFCGLLLGAIQVQPTRDLQINSARQKTTPFFRMEFSSHPANLISLFSPFALKEQFYPTDFFANKCEVNPYNGAFCTIALFWVWGQRKRLGRLTPLAKASAAFGAFMLILSFGYYGYLYRVLSVLPVINTLRCSGRYLLLVDLACAFLSTIAISDLLHLCNTPLKQNNVAWEKLIWLFTPLTLSGLIFLTAYFVASTPGNHPFLATYLSTIKDAFFGVILFTVATSLFLAAVKGRRLALYCLVILTAADLGWHWSTIYSQVLPVKNIRQYVNDLPNTPDPRDGRLLTDAFDDSLYLKQGHKLAIGYVGLFPAKKLPLKDWMDIWQDDYLKENETVSRRLALVRWMHPRKPNGETIDDKWIHGPKPLARVRFVTHAIVSNNVARDINRCDIESTALVEHPLSLQPNVQGIAHIVTERPGHIVVEAVVPSKQLLILSESYHNGWSVRDENGMRPVIPVYGDYQGCVVTPGRHLLVFDFAPKSFDTGRKGTVLGIILTLLLYIFIRFVPVPPRKTEKLPYVDPTIRNEKVYYV